MPPELGGCLVEEGDAPAGVDGVDGRRQGIEQGTKAALTLPLCVWSGVASIAVLSGANGKHGSKSNSCCKD